MEEEEEMGWRKSPQKYWAKVKKKNTKECNIRDFCIKVWVNSELSVVLVYIRTIYTRTPVRNNGGNIWHKANTQLTAVRKAPGFESDAVIS
jgi:hypothetical protein